MSILTKKCSVCGVEKPQTDFYASGGRLSYRCKDCTKKSVKVWAKENPEKRKQIANKYAREHPEVSHGWQKRNPDKALESKSKWRLQNPDKQRSAKLAWYEKPENKKRTSLVAKVWKAFNPDKVVIYDNNRRLKEKTRGTITAEEWADLKKKYGYTCLACKRKEPDIKLELDHVKPLAKGGVNTINNAQPLCPTCNRRKGTKEIDYR